ncbi:MAG: hypothetical protein KDK70_17415 [Myxococcales bacterium]|nr:hypothetical protein [Myxococcales bacterium]
MLKRAAQFTALAIALLLVGVAFKIVMDRRARAKSLESAHAHFIRGTPAEIELSIKVLQLSIDDVAAEHTPTLVAQALVRAHLWVEFGRDAEGARAAVEALSGSGPGVALARAMVAFADGDLDAAQAGLEEDRSHDGESGADDFVAGERAWLQGLLVVARTPDDEAALAEAARVLQERLEVTPSHVGPRRVLALVDLVAGQTDEAQEQLKIAREEHGKGHMGLWADEALLDAYLRQELPEISSVTEQLLAAERQALLSPQDMAHARLARAVVHVQSGEPDEGLALLDEAWGGLPRWDRLARRLAIQTALEAGDASRVEAWVEDTPLPEAEGDIYRAWAVLVKGDVMEALRRLAELPQENPWVGYLQALALVEQGRFAEAGPWIDRTEKLLPGRHEIEVARARVELRTADKAIALRKLEALAQEEAWAPRAWTGLGEAYLLQDEPNESKAREALTRATEREALPAEATLQLAQLRAKRGGKDPDAELEARALYEKAAELNPHLPRYREQLALYVAEIGFPAQARPLMKDVVDEPGVGWPLVLALVRVEADDDDADGGYDPEPRLEEAAERGAPPQDVARLRAWIDVESGNKERLAKAQQALAGLVEANPRDVDAWVLYAKTFQKQFDRKAAESAVRRGIGALDDPAKDGRLLQAWAEIEARNAKTRLAAPRARRAFLHMLDEGRPALELLDVADLATRLWLKLGKERTALSVAKQLTDRLGYHSQAWTIRARTELGAGEAQAARESAQKAIELDGDNPRAYEIQGHAQLRYGYKDEARKSYEKAIELTRGTPQEADYRANLKRL